MEKKRLAENGALRMVMGLLHISVLFLSLALIIYISYDTFKDIPFLESRNYMTFQLVVCVVFMVTFFADWLLAERRADYFFRNFFFLFISVPYLNIISQVGMNFSNEELYYVRFIPLIRGAFALAVVVGYVSTNRISSLFASYMAILLSMIYFASLIFYKMEHPVNPSIPDYSTALWWAFMNVTTLGAPITPVTGVGKILCVFLGGLGMMMFPLFTVFISNKFVKDRPKDVVKEVLSTINTRKRPQRVPAKGNGGSG